MKNLARAATFGTALLLLSKILGFVREICLAYKFGTSYIVDAYTAAIALPSVLFGVYAYGFSDAYIPVYMRIRERKERNAFFSNVVSFLTLVSLIIVIFCYKFSPQLAEVLAPGFEPRGQALLIQFIRLISMLFPILTATSILSAHLQAEEHFIFVQFSEFVLVNILIIAGIFAASDVHSEILIYGYVLAYAAAMAADWWYAVRRKGLRYRPGIQLRSPHFSALCAMAIPLGASRLVNELNGVADRLFASLLGEGVPSALSYANKVQLLFYTLTTSIFISVCYPRINQRFASGDRDGGMYYIKKAIMVSLYVSLPVMGGLFLFSRPVISLLFERGVFLSDSTAMTAGCLAFYSLGIPFYALREIGSRALAANTAQKRILKNTILSVLSNIVLNLLFLRPLKHIGLALATSLTGLITFILMFTDLQKLGLRPIDKAMLRDIGKVIGSSVVSLSLCAVCYRFLQVPLGGHGAILIGISVACLAYGVLSIGFRIEIFAWLYQRLPERVKILPGMKK